jgi:hypothetical protein
MTGLFHPIVWNCRNLTGVGGGGSAERRRRWAKVARGRQRLLRWATCSRRALGLQVRERRGDHILLLAPAVVGVHHQLQEDKRETSSAASSHGYLLIILVSW